VQLIDIELRTTPEHVRLVGRVACNEPKRKVVPPAFNEALFEEYRKNGKDVEVYFEFPRRYESFVSQTADAFAIALMLPSMAAGEPLEIDPPVSETLLFNLTGIQDIFCAWYPDRFQRVPILAEPRIEQRKPRVQRAASFFSGGVDSFYTLLKRLGPDPLPVPLTHMIFMNGVEQKLDNSRGSDLSQQRAEKVATLSCIECISGETNLRTVFPLHWERYYVGAVLAATAVALSEGLGYVCIPSSNTHREPRITGTSPLVDERYSTESVHIVHDGSESGRGEKMKRIVQWNKQLVLQNLRVCFDNSAGNFNCGKCYKCVRTTVALKALGLFGEASTFPDKSTSHWGKVLLEDLPVHTRENLALAQEIGGDPQLLRLLEHVVRKLNRYDALAAFVKNSPLEHLLPIFRMIRQRVGGSERMR